MGAVLSADAASAEVTGVVTLSEHAAATMLAPATNSNAEIFFMSLSPDSFRCFRLCKRSGYETRVPRTTLRQPLAQPISQLGERLPHSLLYSLHGDIQRDCDLGVLESLVSAQLKDLARFIR